MKILLALSSPEYLRFYDETILQLARRGHDVAVAVSAIRDGKPVRLDVIEGLDPRVSIAGLVPDRRDRWAELARAVRGTMDFVRYLHPQLSHAFALRTRVRRKGLPWPLGALDRIPSLGAPKVHGLMRGLARVERAIPVSADLTTWIEAHRPDVLLVSPLVELASDQVDVVRAAQACGVRAGVLVASWDNLTNKGDLRVSPARIFVWNEAQKREAVALHRVGPEQVAVTGAQAFDRWFDRQPSRPRAGFCREVGLPDDAPFVLYTGSSIFIARAEHEMPFVRRWIEALRASPDPAVRALRVLVRPHPYNGQAWDPHVLDDMEGVAIWPRGGYDPVDEGNRAGFFDSMYHCEAVVGINTSAMIESAIVGRPVLSITPPEFAGTQGATLHFHHLLPENGGFVRTATTLDDHVAQLAAILHDPAAARAELDRFVGSFIRPHGRDRPATGMLVDAIEQFGLTPLPAPDRRTVLDRLSTVLAWPLAVVVPLFPPEAVRWSMRKHARHLAVRGDRTWRDTVRAGRVTYGGVVRASRRVWPSLTRAARASRKRARHATRRARYRVGTFARRLRGAPLD